MSERHTQRRPTNISPAQMRALFAAARRATLTIEELRAMTPNKSISRMTAAEAHTLLDRLNAGTRHARPSGGTGGMGVPPVSRPRRTPGIATFVTDGQKLLIDSLRLELGWTLAQLQDFLTKRHYRSDPARSMSQINSSSDAIAVIELLKNVRDRTYAAHRPPHPRQDDTLADRRARLRAARKQTPDEFRTWWNGLRFPDGRYLHAAATTRDLSAAIELATRELAKARAATGSMGAPPGGMGGMGVPPVSQPSGGTGSMGVPPVPPVHPTPEGAA